MIFKNNIIIAALLLIATAEVVLAKTMECDINYLDPKGTVIDQDCVLAGDIDCTSMDKTKWGYCILVNEGVTLDCDGQNIVGPGAVVEPNTGRVIHHNTSGIFMNGIEEGEIAEIRDCNVRDFDMGILVSDVNQDHSVPPKPIFHNEWRPCFDAGIPISDCPNPKCTEAGFPDDLQCCPGRDDIDGLNIVNECKVENCNFGLLLQLSNVELNEVVALNNIRGIQMQICSHVSLNDITACYNTFDIHENSGWSNSCFLADAAGTIMADRIGAGEWDCPNLEDDINAMLGDDNVVACPTIETP